ncbi:MAG TPA: tetratricopeptide repeat protein [Blastocatellia bacterium]
MRVKVCVLTGLLILFAVSVGSSVAQDRHFASDGEASTAKPGLDHQARFAPSNSDTADGNYIEASSFFPAVRCSGCHADSYAGFCRSLHRNAAREPFYRQSVDILLHTQGIEPTRHCESCHTPVALFSGALTREDPKQEAPFTALDDEGVTCTVCHSIVEARLDGTGSYTIRRPALMAKEDGTPIFGDFTDEQILADIPAHKRAVMRPLLRTPEFCATCHKVTAPPELNGYKQIKGFSAYDEWQQSGASLESALPYYKREARADCRTCHMPKIESLNDRAAKNGMIASHQWPGANTAVPLLYNQPEQASLIENFLKTKVLDADIFSVKRDSTGEKLAPLDPNTGNTVAADSGEEITVEVVVSNRGAAHSFPPEVRDLYEGWVQFEAVDSNGKPVFTSGSVAADGTLDPGAHVYRQILVDQNGRVITRHQIWRTTIKAYDNAIPAGRSDVVRYRFRVPPAAPGSGPVTLTFRARVNYRRFNEEYTNFVLARIQTPLAVPVVEMAKAQTTVTFNPDTYAARRRSEQTSPGSTMKPSASSPLASTKAIGGVGPDGVRAVRAQALSSGARQADFRLDSEVSEKRHLTDTEDAESTGNAENTGSYAESNSVLRESRSPDPVLARRWNDYGIALFEQAQYGAAARAFLNSACANPADANPLVSAAVATLKTERFGEDRAQLAKGAELVNQALQLDATNPRARFYSAWVMRAQGKRDEAAAIWKKLAGEYPRDREVQRQLGQTLLQIGDTDGARAAFEAVTRVDPQDAGAYQYLASIYASLGRKDDSARAMSLYHQWRDDPMAQAVANRFYMAHPEWSDERTASHVHADSGGRRGTATGSAASPY